MVSPYKKKKLEKKGRVPTLEEVNPLKYPGNRRTRTSIKPLTDKKFYLDIKNHASLKKIEAKLTSLGARLELFLVREVDYVVTDREDYPRVGGRHQQVPTPSPLPSFCSVSPATPTSPHDGLASKRTRSRAEAMLERVRHQPQTKDTGDILDNAVTWRIPIYPLPRFINWLEKVAKKTEKLYDNGGKIVEKGVRELRGTYLKVETSARPEFKQFSNWPTLGLHKENNAQQNNRNHSNECQRMTRKAGKAAKEASSAPGGGNGYCEMCRIHYDHLDSHVTSVEHLKLVSDPNHYSHLDSIIAEHNLGVTSVRKSLRIAKSPPPFLPPEMGGRQSSEPTINNHSNVNHNHTPTASSPQINGHLTRSKAAANALHSQTPPQPTVHLQCNGSVLERRRSKTQSRGDSPPPPPPPTTRHHTSHHESSTHGRRPFTPPSTPVYQEHNLRPRRTTPRRTTPPPSVPNVSTPAPTPLKETTPPPQPPVTRQQQQSPNVIPSPHQNATPNQPIAKPTLPPPRRTSRVVRKRLSVEEKLIEDNKSYYKVEVLSSKLRSTEYFISQNKVEAQANNRINGTVPGITVVQPDSKTQPKTPVKAPVVVRFKKVRKTELAVLSDEAESFMFGEPKKAASVESSDSSDEGDDDDEEHSTAGGDDDIGNSTGNNDITLSTSRGALPKVEEEDEEDDEDMDDDDEDVKPRLPVLRPPSSPAHSGHPPSSPPRLQHIKEEPDDSAIEKKDITFSFDRAPIREPWLETYRRQDEGNEMYLPQYHSYPSILLPYQISQERHFKKYQSGNITGSIVSAIYPASGSGRRKDRLSKVIDDRPRKSPRCHASTLAIMSSLMRRHRPGRECERPFTYEEDSSLASDIIESSSNSERLVTPQQPFSNGSTSVCAVQQAILSAVLNPEGIDRIGEALLNGKTEISTIEPCLAVDPKAISDGISFVNNSNKGLQMDISTLIDTYHQCTSLEVAALEKAPPRPFESVRFGADSCASSDCSDVFGFLDDGRVVSKKRKRKRNMTGWPQPKRKIVNNNNNNNNNSNNNNNNNNNSNSTTTTPDQRRSTTAPIIATTSTTLRDILEDEPPVDINQFECIVNSSGDDDSPKRRGRPPKTRLNSLNDSPSTPPMFVSSTSSPLRRKVHKLFAHRRSYLK